MIAIPTELSSLALQGGILLFCAFVQSAVGFAFSLFSNALLLLSGLALPETVLLSTLASTLQRLSMTFTLWRHVPWRTTLPLSGVCLLTLPLGILSLRYCAGLDVAWVKAGMGAVVLLLLLLQTAWKVRPRPSLHWGWGALAAAASGWLTGLANIGGPPLLLWIHAHDWPNERTRVTIMPITLLLVPFQLTLLLSHFGTDLLPGRAQVAVIAPAVLAGTALGLAAGRRLSRQRLRAVALGLLAVICLACILDPIL